MKVTVIIPAFNEAKTLQKLLQELRRYNYEIIVVDDGSTDTTFEIASEYATLALRHERNKGKAEALKTGIKEATGDVVVFIDADYEYYPQDIPRLVQQVIGRKCDAVYGNRFHEKPENMKFSHYIGNKIIAWFTSFLYLKDVKDPMTGLKCFKREVLDKIRITSKGFLVEVELTAKILKMKKKLCETPIRYKSKGYGYIRAKDGVKSLLSLFYYRFFCND